MIEIYHAPLTRGIRPIWVCEELGLEYAVLSVDFSAEYRASAQWRRLNPVGKVPVLAEGELTMFESGAMVQYLVDRYGGDGRPVLQPPPGTPEHALYLQWSWFAEATFARPLGEIVNHRRVFAEGERSDRAMEEMRERSWLCVSALAGALESSTWILGETFSAADVMLGYSLKLHTELVSGELPEPVARYWDAISARPGYQAAAAA
jgi:glutathione S-transferase